MSPHGFAMNWGLVETDEPSTCQLCLQFAYQRRRTNAALNAMLPADFEATEVRERRCVICGVPVSKCSLLTDMRDEQHQFLTVLGQLPARLTAEQAAWVLNCQPHDIPALVAAKLIKPLGNPPANGIKFFATADLLEAVKDRNWLVRVSRHDLPALAQERMLRNETGKSARSQNR